MSLSIYLPIYPSISLSRNLSTSVSVYLCVSPSLTLFHRHAPACFLTCMQHVISSVRNSTFQLVPAILKFLLSFVCLRLALNFQQRPFKASPTPSLTNPSDSSWPLSGTGKRGVQSREPSNVWFFLNPKRKGTLFSPIAGPTFQTLFERCFWLPFAELRWKEVTHFVQSRGLKRRHSGAQPPMTPQIHPKHSTVQ